MSCEQIIIEIQNKPALWLSSHNLYKNRLYKNKIWKELATKLNMQESSLKKRWKALKDQYRKELKKQPILRSGAEAESWESSWQYFDIMSFTKDEVLPSKATGNLDINETEDRDRQNESNMAESEDRQSDSDDHVVRSIPSPPGSGDPVPVRNNDSQLSSSAKKRKSDINNDMLEIEKKKLALIETRMRDSQLNEKMKNDEDFLFLQSILPSMKKLNNLQKLRFRGKINNWLLEALTENERASQYNYFTFPSSSESNRRYYNTQSSDEIARNTSDDV